jgi:hypothetical protein
MNCWKHCSARAGGSHCYFWKVSGSAEPMKELASKKYENPPSGGSLISHYDSLGDSLLFIKTEHWHPLIPNHGKQRGLDPVCVDDILVENGPVAGYLRNVDFIINGWQQYFCMYSVFIGLFHADQPILIMDFHPFEKILSTGVPVVMQHLPGKRFDFFLWIKNVHLQFPCAGRPQCIEPDLPKFRTRGHMQIRFDSSARIGRLQLTKVIGLRHSPMIFV